MIRNVTPFLGKQGKLILVEREYCARKFLGGKFLLTVSPKDILLYLSTKTSGDSFRFYNREGEVEKYNFSEEDANYKVWHKLRGLGWTENADFGL